MVNPCETLAKPSASAGGKAGECSESNGGGAGRISKERERSSRGNRESRRSEDGVNNWVREFDAAAISTSCIERGTAGEDSRPA